MIKGIPFFILGIHCSIENWSFNLRAIIVNNCSVGKYFTRSILKIHIRLLTWQNLEFLQDIIYPYIPWILSRDKFLDPWLPFPQVPRWVAPLVELLQWQWTRITNTWWHDTQWILTIKVFHVRGWFFEWLETLTYLMAKPLQCLSAHESPSYEANWPFQITT